MNSVPAPQFADSPARLQDILLDMLYQGNTVGVVHIGRDGNIIATDPDFKRILGLPKDEDIIGENIAKVFNVISLSDLLSGKEFDPAAVPEFVKNVLETGQTKISQVIVKTNDGRNVHMNSWFNGKGDLVSIVRDISDDLRQRRLLEMAMTTANAGYWSLNFITGRYNFSQSVVSRLTDKEIEKMEKSGLWAILHKDDVTQMTKVWQDVIAGHHPFDFTYRVITEKEGEMWQRSVGQLERGASGNIVGATAFVTDITEEVNQRRDLLEQKETSKAQSEFLARMSHEIRTPLNAIIGMADSLADENLTLDIREAVTDIESAAEGLHTLLSKTLDHAKIMSSKMEITPSKCNPHEIIESCAKLWRPQCAAKQLGFNIHISPETPTEVIVDGFRIQQCLNNILSNAVKFTNTGQIDVFMKTTLIKERSHLVIAVKDTGIGMTTKQQKSIFTPFVQADGGISRKYGGTGLGTSIAKQLTELMGGILKLKSVPENGTTFAMIIPILNHAQEAKAFERIQKENSKPKPTMPASNISQVNTSSAKMAPALASEQDVSEAPTDQVATGYKRSIEEITVSMNRSDENGRIPPPKAFEGLSVLCVEDNPMNQKVVGRLIGKHVTSLHFANNGRDALDILAEEQVDVVLMDIHMPIMNGIEATMEIRDSGESWANVAIIALTADPDYQQKSICRQIGMNGTIAKPVRRQDIVDAFDQVLKKQWQKAG